mgnify:CR=1 FL=1
MLLAAASLIVLAHPGCAGSAEKSGAVMKPVVSGAGVRTTPALAPGGARETAPSAEYSDTAFEIAISNAMAADPAGRPQLPAGKPNVRMTAASLGLDESALVKTADNDATDIPSGPLPMFGATVLQQVRDFDAWRAEFDATSQERKRAGFVAQGVMRGVDDPRLVAVWLAVTDVS